MAKEQTDKSRYPSRYSPGGYVTGAQYVIELACEQRARKEKKDLPIRFWNLPEWSLIFKAQLKAVHILLKKYSIKAIIKVVQEKKYDNLRPKWVEADVEQAQLLLNTIVEKEGSSSKVSEVRSQEEIKIPEKRIAKNKLSKLMDLDT